MCPPTGSRRRVPRPRRVDSVRPVKPISVVVRPDGMHPMPRIRIEVQGQTFEADLSGSVVRVGRNPGLDLQLTCDGVAGEHCTIDPIANGRYRLRDGNTGYETRVNGAVVKQVSLDDGDVIEVGEARITYMVGSLGETTVIPSTAAAAVSTPVPAKAAAPARPAAPPAPPKPATDVVASDPKTEAPASTETKTGVAKDDEADTAPKSDDSVERNRERARAAAGKKKLAVPIVALLVATGIAIAIAQVIGDTGGKTRVAAEKQFDAARELYKDKKYAEARVIFADLANDPDAGSVRDQADRYLSILKGVEGDIDRRLNEIWNDRLDFTAASLSTERRVFIADFGDANVQRFDDMKTRILSSHDEWIRTESETTRAAVAKLLEDGKYGKAVARWESLGRGAPVAIDASDAVAAGRTEVNDAAAEAARKLLDTAAGLLKSSGAAVAARYLRERTTPFAGTPAAPTLKERIAEYEALAPTQLDPRPETAPSKQPDGGGDPEPTVPTKTTPAAEDAAQAALEAAAPHAAELAFEQALAELDKGMALCPSGPWHEKLAAVKSDVVRAHQALDALIADIKANQQKYRRIRMSERIVVSLIDADAETVAAAVKGGSTMYRWHRLSPKQIGAIVDRFDAEGEQAFRIAALLHLVGATDAADEAMYDAGQSGVATSALFPVIARWRNEPLPEGGYVVHEERYVTPERRETLLREAAIADAMQRMSDKDADVRKAAYEALIAIGEPAAQRFHNALTSRRAYLIDQVANSKSATSNRYKSKMYGLLKQRRANALALIRDASAYPYPNPTKKGQKEVDHRVGLVREIWERPFDLVAQWDKKLQAELELITEVDEVLSRVDSGYRPDLDEIKDRINLAIDMPAYTPDGKSASRRENYLGVMAYNEKLDTTATEQEKDNTRAVNEYRFMMGLYSVKINERLVRAARGHSRHMKENNYFAHNVPPGKNQTPQNVTPGARAKRQGYGGGVGENIAMGRNTGRGAFWAWYGSSGHHRNMLGGWTEMGCGRWDAYFTQLFGGATGRGLSQPGKLPPPEPGFEPQDEGSTRTNPRGPVRLPDDAPPGGGLFEDERDDDDESDDGGR